MDQGSTAFYDNLVRSAPLAQIDRGWPKWVWILACFIVLSILASSRFGQRLPRGLQDDAFLIVLASPVLFIPLAWMQSATARSDGDMPRWRVSVSLFGCVALSVALAIPLFLMFFGFMIPLDWLFVVPLNWFFFLPLGSSALAMLCGICGAKPARFSLFFGGLTLGCLVIIIPKGIL